MASGGASLATITTVFWTSAGRSDDGWTTIPGWSRKGLPIGLEEFGTGTTSRFPLDAGQITSTQYLDRTLFTGLVLSPGRIYGFMFAQSKEYRRRANCFGK